MLRFMLLFLLLAASACSGNVPPVSLPVGQLPTPYSDTPSPDAIPAPRVQAPSILSLDMFNELDGWAVTEREIVRTNDGGISWYNVTPPGMQEAGYSVDAFFLDTQHAWVQKPDLVNFPNGGTLSRTSDGGRTWTEFSVPFSRGNLAFVDSETGWVLADQGAGAGSNAVAVFRTTNGGVSWRKTNTNDPNDPRAMDSLPLGGIKTDLVPLDADNLWMTGVVYTPGEVLLYRSYDGGINWMPATLALPPGTEGFEFGIEQDGMGFVSSMDGFLVLRVSNDSMQTAVYLTRDAGNTWSLTPTQLNGAGPASFLTAQEAVLYNGGQFHVTRDAAQTWVAVSPDIAFGETFVDMEFVNTMSGWVITMDPSNHRSLYRTYDGGSTWLPVVP